jgi:DNA repair protein RadD
MYELRDYQAEAAERGLRYFKSQTDKKPVIEVLPTGSGKSLVIAEVARRLNEPILIFQPSKEILEQNYKKLLNYEFYDTSIFSASFNQKEISLVTFATIGSVISKPELFRQFKNIMVDECHFVNSKGGMYKQFFDIVGEKILGLTATPYRLTTDGYGGSMLKFITRTRPRIFHDVIYHVQNKNLYDRGYLAKLDYFQIKGFDTSKLELNSTGADYTDNSVRKYYEEISFEKRLIKVINRLLEIGRKNILIFTRFTKEAENLARNIPGAATVSAETSMKEREGILNDFISGEIKVIANVGVLTTGFDYPELETIVIARPTRSLALYYQMIGRGIRPHPFKEKTMIVDLCDNFSRFGKVEDLELKEPKPGLWHIDSRGKQLTNVYYD